MCFRIKEHWRTAKPILMLLQLSARRSAGSGGRLREKTETILGRSVRKQRSCVVVCVFSQYLGGRGRQIHSEPQTGPSYIVRPCLRQTSRERKYERKRQPRNDFSTPNMHLRIPEKEAREEGIIQIYL